MKRIFIHPSRLDSLKLGEEFDIDSGLGGSFTVRFNGWRCHGSMADFVITSSSPPPEGWRGEERSFQRNQLTTTLYLLAPASPFMDEGTQEFAALRRLGYSEASPQFIELKSRTALRPPKLYAVVGILRKTKKETPRFDLAPMNHAAACNFMDSCRNQFTDYRLIDWPENQPHPKPPICADGYRRDKK